MHFVSAIIFVFFNPTKANHVWPTICLFQVNLIPVGWVLRAYTSFLMWATADSLLKGFTLLWIRLTLC